jgi:hypothetical protein
MRTTAEFLLAPLLFAALITFANRLLGRYGALVLAAGWAGALSAYILASAPGPDVPLHAFEKTPVPALLATFAATAAATAFACTRSETWRPPVTWLATAVVYLAVAIPVDIAALLFYMM